MKIAVIGGGINGVMTSWEFAKKGNDVSLFEQSSLISETSRKSTKMLHGGLRYIENAQFSMVRQSQLERSWWLTNAPSLTKKIEILIPIYKNSQRPKWLIGLGVKIYDALAYGSGFPRSKWISRKETLALIPTLNECGLIGAYSYWDAQMDDYQLGLWAADAAKSAGVNILEHTKITEVDASSGKIAWGTEHQYYDLVINATGPWAFDFSKNNQLGTKSTLELVKGSHLIIPGSLRCGCVMEVKGEKRIIFALPGFHGNILLGTTESIQSNPKCLRVSDQEELYLLSQYNRYFNEKISQRQIIGKFSGVRAVVKGSNHFSAASRDASIERTGKVVSIFGGKWTASRLLAKKVFNFSMDTHNEN
jgi:glycerol-3-phosphate dehydrogenase